MLLQFLIIKKLIKKKLLPANIYVFVCLKENQSERGEKKQFCAFQILE